MRALWLVTLALSSIQSVNAETSSNNTGDQLQAFTFGYTTSNLVLPVIYTCPSPLLITALKPTNAGGPDPSAPYTMIAFVHEQLQDDSGQRYERLYARSMSVGDLGQDRTFSHPWAEGTQFIGCIWSVRRAPIHDYLQLVNSRLTTGQRSERRLPRSHHCRAEPKPHSGCVRVGRLAMPRAECDGLVGHRPVQDARCVCGGIFWSRCAERMACVL